MGCCGQKREQLTKHLGAQGKSIPLSPGTSRTAVSARSLHHGASNSRYEIRIRYLGSSYIRVLGSATSRIYEFSVHKPTHAVDTRDAHALLKTRYFSRA